MTESEWGPEPVKRRRTEHPNLDTFEVQAVWFRKAQERLSKRREDTDTTLALCTTARDGPAGAGEGTELVFLPIQRRQSRASAFAAPDFSWR
jgi:hypothetical protein